MPKSSKHRTFLNSKCQKIEQAETFAVIYKRQIDCNNAKVPKS